jgi:hypothetical protein
MEKGWCMIGGGSAVVVVVLDGGESERVPGGQGQRGLGGWIMCNQSRNEFLFIPFHSNSRHSSSFFFFDAGNYRAAMCSVSGDGVRIHVSMMMMMMGWLGLCPLPPEPADWRARSTSWRRKAFAFASGISSLHFPSLHIASRHTTSLGFTLTHTYTSTAI